MNTEIWERNGEGDLISQKAKIEVTDKLLAKEIKLLERQTTTIKDKKQLEVNKRAISLLKEALAEKTETIEFFYTPLMYYEIQYINQGLGITGKIKHDVDAEICALHCSEPVNTYEEWRDMKDPLLKLTISSYIIEHSLPKREKSKKEMEAFQMLQ